ncbi:hypothetical protein LWF01_01705 [Saxibacter everestensis]|uniref:Uncharacterized protein n=1 Tax=Saxibacter everestensis TaxID=2909229 RepID=A0ABY8QU91_9MICO|nr:hypothetical protein LWF01_01705 [Brevibacteriaceae bacterium ZFBP1038]
MQRQRIVMTLVLLVILAVAVLAGVFGIRAYQVTNELKAALASADTLKSQLTSDPDAAVTTLNQLQGELETAQASADSQAFAGGERLPWLGPNVSAVRTMTSAFRTIADDALPPVVALARLVSFETGQPRGGISSLPEVLRLTDEVPPALKALDSAQAEIAGIDTSTLVPQLASVVSEAQGALDEWQEKLALLQKIVDRLEQAGDAVRQGSNDLESLLKKYLGG